MTNTHRTSPKSAFASILMVLALLSSTTVALAAAPKTTPAKPGATPSAASDPAPAVLLGDWAGILDTGKDAAKLRLALHLGKNPDGTLNGSMDSLDENVKGIPVDKANFADGKLGLNLPQIGVHCELTLAKDRVEMKGTWFKGDSTFPLEFKKEAAQAAEHAPGS